MNIIEFDASDFFVKIDQYVKNADSKRKKANHDVASAILLISQSQVPHDTGELQNSGMVEDKDEHSIVGYNKVYASRLHEHPEYNFQKGRKAKYLEDPIKNHMNEWKEYFMRIIQ